MGGKVADTPESSEDTKVGEASPPKNTQVETPVPSMPTQLQVGVEPPFAKVAEVTPNMLDPQTNLEGGGAIIEHPLPQGSPDEVAPALSERPRNAPECDGAALKDELPSHA